VRYNWPEQSQDIIQIVESKNSVFKIILKTKNETEILDEWLEHHLNIVGDHNVIVFDNGSSNKKTFEIYNKYINRINLFGFYDNHNLVHNVEFFSEFYESLRKSCKFYSFIDADEFLYFTDGNVLFSDIEFMNVLNRANEEATFFGLWSFNVPGNKDIFYITNAANTYSSGLKGGKPILSSKYILKGFINHNFQLYHNNSYLNPMGGLLVCHLNMVDRKRRIMINREKILAHKFLKDNNEIDEIILNNNLSKLTGNLSNYIKEIIHCRDQKWTTYTDPPAGCFKINADRSVIFSNENAHAKLVDFSRNCSVHWNSLIAT
jgi:hypothetical protein